MSAPLGYQSRFEAKFGSDPVAAMAMSTDKKDANGNDMYVWQDYVAGTDPTDTNSVFKTSIDFVDGTQSLLGRRNCRPIRPLFAPTPSTARPT